MKSNLIATVVVAAAALTSFGASAQTFNSYAVDQAKAPTTRTRAEVKAEAAQAARESVGKSNFIGALAQPNDAVFTAEKAGAPAQASAGFVKTAQ